MFTQCIHVHRVGPRRRGECIENRCSHSAFMYIELGLEGGRVVGVLKTEEQGETKCSK